MKLFGLQCLLYAFLIVLLVLPETASASLFLETPCTAVLMIDVVQSGEDGLGPSLWCQTPSFSIYAIPVDEEWIEEKLNSGDLKSGKTLLKLPSNTEYDPATWTILLDSPPGLINKPLCKRFTEECSETTDCCAGSSCRRVSPDPSESFICRPNAKDSKDKISRGDITTLINCRGGVGGGCPGRGIRGAGRNLKRGVLTLVEQEMME